jgi:adenosylcobinamide kinase/adenosylcobinamide-phosphate guanylyltransferase
MTISLILGGVKSGKSALAERQAINSQLKLTYIATATAGDSAMRQRINYHQQQRPTDWKTIEEPIYLAKQLQDHCADNHCILIDCLTLWLTNLLMQADEALLRAEINAFVASLANIKGQLIIVSNETNMGIMPLGEITRRYCDEIGLLHQTIAALSDNVVLTVAGLPHILKGKLNDRV